MRSKAISGGSLLSVKNGIWAKDGNEFIYIKRITDDIALSDVYIYRFAENRQLQQVKHANTATYQEGNGFYIASQNPQFRKMKLRQ